MTRRFAAILTLAVCASFLAAGAAQAATVKDTFDYHIGDGFAVLNNTGDRAMAENGDIVTVRGSGTFDVIAKTATGGGTFTHKNSGGSVVATGTWTATGLLSFQSYGDGTPQGTPPTFFGGRAALAVALTPTGTGLKIPGILEVECLLGDPPGGAHEGIRLLVKDDINFNQTVRHGGATVFVRT